MWTVTPRVEVGKLKERTRLKKSDSPEEKNIYLLKFSFSTCFDCQSPDKTSLKN